MRSLHVIGLVLLLTVLPGTLFSGAAESEPAAPPPGHAEEEAWVELEFPGEVELTAIIEYVQKRTGTHFLYDDRLRNQKVMLRTAGKVRVSSLLPLLQSALRYRGFALVRSGEWLQVVKNEELPRAAVPVIPPGNVEALGAAESAVTQVVRLREADPEQVKVIVQPLLSSPGGSVLSVPGQRCLVVTDFASNVQRILELVQLLDLRPAETVVRSFPLKYRPAGVVAQKLTELFQQKARFGVPQTAQAAPSAFFGVDPSGSAVTCVALAGDMPEVEELVRAFDSPTAAAGEVRFYKLEYCKATDAVSVLRQLVGGSATPPGKAEAPAAGEGPMEMLSDARTNTVLIRALPEQHEFFAEMLERLDVPVEAERGELRVYKLQYTSCQRVAEVVARVLGEKPPPTAEGKPSAAEPVSRYVFPDLQNNAVVVSADADLHAELASLIAQLDARRPQVLLELTVVEVTRNTGTDLGVELRSPEFLHRTVGGATSFGLSQVDPATGSRTILALPGFTGVIVSDEEAVGLLHALTSEGRGRVLSRPRVLVNDNTPAVFKSTAMQPVTETVALNVASTTTSFKQYVEAGVDLQITPHISEDDFVQMLVNTKVEQFSGPAPAPGIPPPKTSNEIQTEVRVPDRSTIVIGGLTRTTETDSVDKVPILGDVPLLGFFFRHTVTNYGTSTLYIFIRSEVMKAEDYADLIELSSQSARDAHKGAGREGRASAGEAR